MACEEDRFQMTNHLTITSVCFAGNVTKIKSSLQIYPTNVFHRNGGTFVGFVGLVFL
ncbi:MAG: hypothetical protein MR627_06360 [Prevotella sp.]|nr:hypothetical protein [Prevotella sp.]